MLKIYVITFSFITFFSFRNITYNFSNILYYFVNICFIISKISSMNKFTFTSQKKLRITELKKSHVLQLHDHEIPKVPIYFIHRTTYVPRAEPRTQKQTAKCQRSRQ